MSVNGGCMRNLSKDGGHHLLIQVWCNWKVVDIWWTWSSWFISFTTDICAAHEIGRSTCSWSLVGWRVIWLCHFSYLVFSFLCYFALMVISYTLILLMDTLLHKVTPPTLDCM